MGSSFLIPPAKRRPLYHSSASMPDPNPSLAAAAAAAAAASGHSKRSRPPPPPLSVPPGHAAFRLLCHASRIGGVIGKSGATIKQLQQVTGAKIRVEDAPQESPDRVITVIASSAVSSKISVSPSGGEDDDGSPPASDGSGDVEGELEVSKAQEALIRVFERILEVAAESNGVAVGVGVVSCRVLAGKSQAGSVIGRGGKTVEKIRKESGCKIRVLTEQLPACAAAGEEMIEVRE